MKHFIVFISIFFILIAGCSNEIEVERNEILVQKRVGEKKVYEHSKTITDNATIEKVEAILEDIRWENAEVSMVSPPHYKFSLEGTDEQAKVIYSLWISPNKDKVELVVEGESKYGQLSKSTSAKLFELLTGEKLSDVE
ncbi:hypothetical protein AAGS61_15195 [Lysinibacillus sp. KU-BSD001]|uniref:hypothetical protein n=1 Tax=Lysinibacillus sp. KU-BSD001 TaxID=3141328 RepID=UPI0036E88525